MESDLEKSPALRILTSACDKVFKFYLSVKCEKDFFVCGNNLQSIIKRISVGAQEFRIEEI